MGRGVPGRGRAKGVGRCCAPDRACSAPRRCWTRRPDCRPRCWTAPPVCRRSGGCSTSPRPGPGSGWSPPQWPIRTRCRPGSCTSSPEPTTNCQRDWPTEQDGSARRGLHLTDLVAELRRAVTDPTVPERTSMAAATQLARLASAGVVGAHPRDWYGLADLSSIGPAIPDDRPVTVSPSTVENLTRCALRGVLERRGARQHDEPAADRRHRRACPGRRPGQGCPPGGTARRDGTLPFPADPAAAVAACQDPAGVGGDAHCRARPGSPICRTGSESGRIRSAVVGGGAAGRRQTVPARAKSDWRAGPTDSTGRRTGR